MKQISNGLWSRVANGSEKRARKAYWYFFKPQIVVMLGGPGSGKGTTSTKLARKLRLGHLSTGDALRAAIQAQTPLGLKAKKYVDNGMLVPDAIAISIILEHLEKWKNRRGLVLDGAIRTHTQAKALDLALQARGLGVTKGIWLDPAEDVLINRLSQRVNCSNTSCGRSYHLTANPPKVAGICDACKSALYQRKDDVPEVISARLTAYRREIEPICKHYEGKLIVVRPTEAQTPDEVFAEVINAYKAKPAKK